MAPIDDDFKIILPVKSSLLNLASVSIALPLFNEFDTKTLNIVFKEIQVKDSSEFNKASQENFEVKNNREKENKTFKETLVGDSSSLNEAYQGSREVKYRRSKRIKVLKEIKVGDSSSLHEAVLENRDVNYNRAKEIIHFIPRHLRTSVIRAVIGIQSMVSYWKRHHSSILDTKDDKSFFYWKSDGTIDCNKTAQQLVLKENIDTTVRFKIACMYGFEESMQTLKAEMELSGEIQQLKVDDRSMMSVGVRWLREEDRIPWIQAIRDYLEPRMLSFPPTPRFSSFFPLLRPEERDKFLFYLNYTTLDDIRICMHTLTKAENEKILKMHSFSVLVLHLRWPMQKFFLQTAAKLGNYITCMKYKMLVCHLLHAHWSTKDFDYGELFESFWDNSPSHQMESAEQFDVLLKKCIDNYMKWKYEAKPRADTERLEKRKIASSRRILLERKCKKKRC